ncbi:DUF4416 family protein [Acidobacteriota bacterium]
MKPTPFHPVKLVCGMISSKRLCFERGEDLLKSALGRIDLRSDFFSFTVTDYYEKEMGPDLSRQFVSFENLIAPEELAAIKINTNKMEDQIKDEFKSDFRVINLDPGYLSSAALVMATAKNFSHRIPLADGIYAHLEFLFGKKNNIRLMEWTYPDFRLPAYEEFFLKIRETFLVQLQNI